MRIGLDPIGLDRVDKLHELCEWMCETGWVGLGCIGLNRMERLHVNLPEGRVLVVCFTAGVFD